MLKKITNLIIISACSVLSANYAAAQGLMINEIMQSNVGGLYYEHEFPDSWVELYNPTDQTINLQDWVLSDGKDSQKFSSKDIPAKGYAIIYCDKEDAPFHTPFRVESGKGELYLYDPSGVIADEISFKK